ncbi:hypothetical protein E2C01_062678 [Portunus trituberculatus]|uniref:Uncharacterized protein n=1 Tax=Portunus trituberculatus TaxID=210409 RepID=A0A5B7HGR2_PORTR|nr:hypothetical protein [Portunus trituberculatus]
MLIVAARGVVRGLGRRCEIALPRRVAGREVARHWWHAAVWYSVFINFRGLASCGRRSPGDGRPRGQRRPTTAAATITLRRPPSCSGACAAGHRLARPATQATGFTWVSKTMSVSQVRKVLAAAEERQRHLLIAGRVSGCSRQL